MLHSSNDPINTRRCILFLIDYKDCETVFAGRMRANTVPALARAPQPGPDYGRGHRQERSSFKITGTTHTERS